jgi:hypothetical protein
VFVILGESESVVALTDASLVGFELVKTSGLVHKDTDVVQCSCFTSDPETLFVEFKCSPKFTFLMKSRSFNLVLIKQDLIILRLNLFQHRLSLAVLRLQLYARIKVFFR